MSAKHTPGPWKCAPQDRFHTYSLRQGTMEPISTDEALANARLIAAAPDLFGAARLVMKCNPGAVYLNGTDGEMYAEWELLAQAIAKSKGE